MTSQNEARAAVARRRASGCLSPQNDNPEIAHRPSPANALTAVLDREGMVIGIVAGRIAARAFLREAHL